MTQTGVVAGGALTDWVSLGVLASSVPRDVVDDAVAAAGKGARRAGGKLPPHVMVYFVMALALFADDDYEEVAARLTQTLRGWGWDDGWEVPTRGGITQARQRLGPEPLAGIFSQVAEPVAGLDTIGAFFGTWRLMSVDGMEWDVPDTQANRAAFGSRGGSEGPGAYPKVRVVTVSECASHAAVLAAMGPAAGGKGGGEQSLARRLLLQLQEDWLLIADRNFYCFKDWCTAADTGAALLWRVKSDIRLPVLELLPDGSYRSVLVNPKITWNKRKALLEAAARGDPLQEDQARYVRVVEYEVPDREGDGTDALIALVTTITDARLAPAQALAMAYHQRWEHEGANAQLKTSLRGPGRILRSQSPALVEQEIWGYLLTHYAISALTCAAATAAGVDPDRVKFTRTLRIIRRAVGPAFPP
jgi:Insertion element 4 transposase N-terminal